ncbi:MAG: hypothetical protein V1859_04320 [archaeon]
MKVKITYILILLLVLLFAMIDNDPRNLQNDSKFVVLAKNYADGYGVSSTSIDGHMPENAVSYLYLPMIVGTLFNIVGYSFFFAKATNSYFFNRINLCYLQNICSPAKSQACNYFDNINSV